MWPSLLFPLLPSRARPGPRGELFAAGATLGMDRRFMSPDVIRNQVRKKARVVERAIKDIDCHLL